MKAVLMSIRPKWVEKIANGAKTIEVRKSKPNLETPFKCYIYCTNTPKFHHLYDLRPYSNGKITLGCVQHNSQSLVADNYINGKVIGEFVCDRIDSYVSKDDDNREYWDLSVKEWEDLKQKSCLSIAQIIDYTGDSDNCYGWHITDLKIYDKPKELSEFKKSCPYTDGTYCIENKCEYYGSWTGVCRRWVERPPQSWCYVEEL